MTQWLRCSRPPHCAPSPASATPSSPATAACPTASMRASTAASAPTTRPPRSPRTAPAWRRRSASRPDRLLTAYQIHSPDVVTIEQPWRPHERPRADAIVTARAGARHRRHHRRLRPGAVRRRNGRRHRRRPCRLARRRSPASSKRRSPPWSGAGPTAGASRSRSGRRSASRTTRSGPNSSPGSRPRTARTNGSSARRRRPEHALFDLPGYIAARLAAAGIRQIEDLGLCTYADATRFFSYRRSTHRGEPDYGRHVNAIALAD